jgi:phytoene synthase
MRELLAVPSLGELGNPRAYLARHSRSFRFAAALLRGPERDRVVRVYAWCRFTDDLVDGTTPGTADAGARLDEWMAVSRAAYDGRPSGVALIDRVMGDMAERSIPFKYAEALGVGMRSDLQFSPFADMDHLRIYTYRVAGVVGQWLTELHDVHDPWMLDRAAALGHAMQLTNILRDVGEDWDRGRVYLPTASLDRHGVSLRDLGAMRRGERPVTGAYRDLVEDLMDQTMRDYRLAREALPGLPPAFRRSVAVAAAVYEGILTAIRRNGYDNFGQRAFTTTTRKMALAAEALWSAARASGVYAVS